MAIDMFLKLGEVEGESHDGVHTREIDIHSLSWGMAQPGSMHTGNSRGTGKIRIRDLSLTKSFDGSSPRLMMACSSGAHYSHAVLTVRNAGGDAPVPYVTITLQDVMVTSYSTHATEGDELMHEQFSLTFGKVEVSYPLQSGAGIQEDGPVQYGWDIRKNEKI